jgi:predicted nucleic acid-binding protein
MRVLIDTPIWSLALRRKPKGRSREEEALQQELAELIREGRAQLMGPIRQEVLSGIREEGQYRRLRDHLRAFDDALLTTEDYEEAARASNQCRAVGIAGSAIDFLICAVAIQREWQIFTTDKDFAGYAKHLHVGLYVPRDSQR